MKKLTLLIALCALTIAANAETYNYICAITEIKVDTLKDNTKNQFTLRWSQNAKNTNMYKATPTEEDSLYAIYPTTVKLVINSDDRTLEGTYTTVGSSTSNDGSNPNANVMGLITSEFYYGTKRRLLRDDSVSTLTIVKIDENQYAITAGRLCFTDAPLQDRGKHTYKYNYCYNYSNMELQTKNLEPKPFVFGYSGEYVTKVYNYDMTVNGISVVRDDTDYSKIRYFLALNCSGTNREDQTTRNYDVQLSIYPDAASIVGSYSTQGGEHLLYSSNCYIKDLKINKTRYLANDSVSTIQIKSKGENQYSFYGGTLICADEDFNYSGVYNLKRIESVHYYHFSDNGGEGISFGYDESSSTISLTINKVEVSTTATGYSLTVSGAEGAFSYNIIIETESEQLTGTFTATNGLNLYTKVERGSSSSYITSNGSTVTINHKGGNTYTLSGNLICENGYTYQIPAFDFTYGTATGIQTGRFTDSVQTRKFFRDGQLIIVRDGKEYNAYGVAL